MTVCFWGQSHLRIEVDHENIVWGNVLLHIPGGIVRHLHSLFLSRKDSGVGEGQHLVSWYGTLSPKPRRGLFSTLR